MKSKLTVHDLREIAGRASTIDERLAGGYVPVDPGAEQEHRVAVLRLEAWRHAAGDGNLNLLTVRLLNDGTDPCSVLPLLGRVRLADDQPLPVWARAFRWIEEAMQRSAQEQGLVDPDSDAKPIAFEELLWPVVLEAERRLEERLDGKLAALFTDSARASLRRGLLNRLSRFIAPALFHEFSIFRHLELRPTYGLPLWEHTSASRDIYDRFVADFRKAGARELFLSKPVVARMMGTVAAQWLDGTAELAERLGGDVSALADAFAGGRRLGAAASIESDLSDPHRGGRTVAILGFASGLKLVYKPKDMHIDLAWAGFVRWLQELGAPIALKAPAVLAREGYGWAAHVEAQSGIDDEDAATFYARAGGLLAVLHLLQGTDFHSGNVIVSQRFPVPIDLETLLHPDLRRALTEVSTDPASMAAMDLMRDSVLATHYLPHWLRLPDGRPVEIGGLAGPPALDTEDAVFRNVNTNAMALGKAETGSDRAPSETESGGRTPLGRAQYAGVILEGFTAMYSFLMSRRDQLLGPAGLAAQFGGLRVRAVLGPTLAYALLQKRAAGYSHLSDGAQWSLHFDFLGRRNVLDELPEECRRILAAERRALANLDVPFVAAQTDAKWLAPCTGNRIEGCLPVTGLEQVLARVRGLSSENLRFQARLIQSALVSAEDDGWSQAGEIDWADPSPSIKGLTRTPDTAEAAIAAARRIGLLLDRIAVRAGGSAVWVGTVPVDHEHAAVSVAGPDLYSGTCGIALFVAALARATGERRFRELALAALGSVRQIRSAADGGARAARLMGIGGAAGIGSVIYGLVHIAAVLDEAALLEEAGQIALLVDQKLVATDHSYDVMYGAAGAILGLLALHRVTGDRAILERAALCGRHLLASEITDDKGNRGWRTVPGMECILTGFSHGAAGIALALLRLHNATGQAEFQQGAQDGIRYERRLFMREAGNWPDLRSSEPHVEAVLPCQWCHGAAGIGLARLGCQGLMDDDQVATEIDEALATTLKTAASPYDHLCCGNFGRLDFVLTAARRLQREDLFAIVEARASRLLERATVRGGFHWRGGDDNLNPGFFRGISGIGYQLLRIADHGALPSVLLWEDAVDSRP